MTTRALLAALASCSALLLGPAPAATAGPPDCQPEVSTDCDWFEISAHPMQRVVERGHRSVIYVGGMPTWTKVAEGDVATLRVTAIAEDGTTRSRSRLVAPNAPNARIRTRHLRVLGTHELQVVFTPAPGSGAYASVDTTEVRVRPRD